jgi:starch synthase
VVATDTGGIPEVVDDGVTGLLVPFTPADDGLRTPVDAEGFADGIAQRVNALLHDPERATAMGKAGRERAVEEFSWSAVAERTAQLYQRLLAATAS